VEYTNGTISAFLQGAVSNQSFQRIEYFNELPENQKSEKKNLTGGNIKGGLNYNINENHNVFFNTGYYSKQPLFDAVFINFSNTINPDLQNEQIFGLEFGYGYRSSAFSANVNFYRTSWADRFLSRGGDFDLEDGTVVQGTANYYGIKQVHMGLEIDFIWRILDNLRLNGFGSFANWEYQDDVIADIFNDDQELVGSSPLFLKGAKVGDAAQTTFGLGLDYSFLRGFNAGLNWRYAGKLYSDFDPIGFLDEDNQGAVELPSYNLVDARISYNWRMQSGTSLEFAVMANNIFDELYISESDTNYHLDERPGDEAWNGVNTRNRVFFGFGTTWNTSIRFRF
jgi:outer membrane receptor for ferrienterochelin and colicin